MLEFFAIVLCAYFVLCVVACIFQPKTPLPSLTETYKTLTIENEIEEVLIEGRQKFPPYKKLNLVWWFLNEYESTPPNWYHRGQNFWLRLPSWYMRNPFQNAGNYVFGVCDRDLRRSRPAAHRAQVVDHQPRLLATAVRLVCKRAVSRLCGLATERLLRRQIQSEEHEPSGRLVESCSSYVPFTGIAGSACLAARRTHTQRGRCPSEA